MYAAGDRSVADIAKLLGVSRQTVYRALEPEAVALLSADALQDSQEQNDPARRR